MPNTTDAARDNEQQQHQYALGDIVVDSDAEPDDRNTAVVVAQYDEPAYAVHIDVLDASVADVNPEYGASGAVVDVAFAGTLDKRADGWRSASPDALAALCDDLDVPTYSYPVERLREVNGE